jgi:hypothetical protein
MQLRALLNKAPGARALYLTAQRLTGKQPVERLALRRGRRPKVDRTAMRQHYQASPLCREPETFVLYRIIGNDLVPRHRVGQSVDNLRFILDNEPDLPGCEKRFVLNRIVNPEQEQQARILLESAGIHYLHLPFNPQQFAKTGLDSEGLPKEYNPSAPGFEALSGIDRRSVLMRLYRHKNNAVMNNNGARNAALREGRALAKWVLPWDGNCFLTKAAWSSLTDAVRQSPEMPYFIVPMARVTDNHRLLEPEFHPTPSEEPQILFRRDAKLEFDERYFYGRRPKVELLWRLGVPGPWDEWEIEPWDLPAPAFAEEAGRFMRAGWVARLDSGQQELEHDSEKRRVARADAVIGLLKALDARLDRRDDGPSQAS